MSIDPSANSDQKWVKVPDSDLKAVFQAPMLLGQNVQIPGSFQILPDVRPASDTARREALQGLAPKASGLPQFDPQLGPFALPEAQSCSWAQSLEFLRDIAPTAKTELDISLAWITQWVETSWEQAGKTSHLFFKQSSNSTKTDRLIWRARRVLNCLAYVLPRLHQFKPQVLEKFWAVFFTDCAKLSAPTATFWSGLLTGGDQLSHRALWLRAMALLCVDASLPGYLKVDVRQSALEQVKGSVQGDGLIKSSSIIGTLSAAADLSMIGELPDIAPLLGKMQTALTSLRRVDGTIVTFGSGSNHYSALLQSVLGPKPSPTTNLLLEGGIVRVSAGNTTIWLRTPQQNATWGATCEIDVHRVPLLISAVQAHAAVGFDQPVKIAQSRCKRRDEADAFVLESNATLVLGATSFNCLRQVRISLDGGMISGEDHFHRHDRAVLEALPYLCFPLAENCAPFLSKDRKSVLIVTSEQQAWRFRCEGMDISLEMVSETQAHDTGQAGAMAMICRPQPGIKKSGLVAHWQFVFEVVG